MIAATSDGASGAVAGSRDESRLSAPSLGNRWVGLRALAPADLTALQLIETSTELAPRWRLRGSTPSPEQWAQEVFGHALAQFLVIPAGHPEPIGIVVAYQADFQDGYAHVAAAKLDSSYRSPAMVIGMGLFLDYVFHCWDFHKLYSEVPEYNYDQFASGYGRFFSVEARLRDHSYLGGRRWDQMVLAIYRHQWDAEREAIARLLDA